MSPRRRTPAPAALAVVAAVAALGLTAVVVASPAAVDGPAAGDVIARRLVAVGDVATVYNVGVLSEEVERGAIEAARAIGAAATTGRSASIGALRITRDGSPVQVAPDGLRIPFSVTSLPAVAVTGVMGADISALLGPTTVVMGELTASLRGARGGDRIDLVAADGSVRTMTIAAVVADDRIGGTELLMSYPAADQLGITTATRVVIWGFTAREALEAALRAQGMLDRRETRVLRSWDPPNPDATLSTARTKQLLGEFAYSPTDTDSIVQEAAWQAANLPAGRELLSAAIPIRARCHVRIAAALTAALDEAAAAGLAPAIDVGNANTYGGCHNPRYNRINGELGVISRHAWAQALDTNTVTNCQGCRPQMNCDVVRIFRKHGFAWGGNFLRPDGMHFEWVGERRDQVVGPSTYCPNLGQPTTASVEGAAMTGDSRPVLFVEDPVELDDAGH